VKFQQDIICLKTMLDN